MPRSLDTFGSVVLAGFCILLGAGMAPAQVKLSNSGICHDSESPWHGRTQSYTPYDRMEACLEVGRAYSGYDGGGPDGGREAGGEAMTAAGSRDYDRDLYGSWADADGDCRNTRHELLAELSTAPVQESGDGCYIQRGRWNDPYTGEVFLNSRDMDVDHLVPLAWAHARGGYDWAEETRRAFANDMRNLYAVDAGTNRSKGADGPVDWMPPNRAFHCQYILRFDRIVRLYGLEYRPGEGREMNEIRERVCQ